jgi:hypothetical protein
MNEPKGDALMENARLRQSELCQTVVVPSGKKCLAAATALCQIAALVLFSGIPWRAGQGQAEKTMAPGLETKQNQQVVRLPGDTLVSFYLQSGEEGQVVVAKSSKDNGGTWSELQTALRLPKETAAFKGLYSLVGNDGKVHLFFFNDSGIWYSRPGVSEAEWQVPRAIFKGYVGVLRSALQLRSGRLVLPFYYGVKRDWWDGSEKGFDRFTYMGNYVTSTLYSDDGGLTWQQSPEIIKIPTPSLNQNGAVDPVILEMKDGRIWMLIANQRGWLYEAFSRDGVAWSENRPSHFISAEAPACLTRLKDGRIVLIWNSCLRFPYLHGGMYVLHAAISEDDGKIWRGYREIYRDPYRGEPEARGAGYGTGYPTAVGTADGRILVRTGQGKSETTLLLDPSWLYETRQREDFSHGLEDWSVFGSKGVELIPNPGKVGAKALSIRKAETEWPAAAVWNFPAGKKGVVRVRLRLKKGFRGADLCLTDHFSVPFDPEAELNSLYELSIPSDGKLGPSVRLEQDRSHNISFQWDFAQRKCTVWVDGRQALVLPQLKLTDSGANYLRLHATAEQPGDAGFLVESLEADVSAR